MEIKYTKINKIHEVNNSMCHNFYYIYYGRIYNENKTRYRKFKYIMWFDIFDLQENYEKETITKEEIRQYAEELESSYLLSIHDYDDMGGLKAFYNWCNETIRDYNKILN